MNETVHISSPVQAEVTSFLDRTLESASPQVRGEERAMAALVWIYRWGWASAATLEILCGVKGTRLAQRLIKNQLVINTKTKSRLFQEFLPGSFFTLTLAGKHVAEINLEKQIRYEHRPDRVNQNILHHDEAAQRVTAKRLSSGEISDFISDKEIKDKCVNGVKIPDAVWIYPNGKKFSIEIEFSPKWERDFDFFLHSTLMSLSTNNGPANFDGMILLTDLPAIYKRYREAFKPGNKFWTWQKNESGRWIKDEQKTVPNWTAEKITWQLMSKSSP